MSKFFFNNIPIKKFVIRLKFKKEITFHYYHGAKIYGFLSRIFEWHPTPKDKKNINDIVIYPCESGRITYNPGDEYCFAITFLKNDSDLIEKLKINLLNIPNSDYPGDLTNESIELVSITEETEQQKFIPMSGNIYSLKFISPLRIERKEEDKEKGKRFFDPEYFDLQQVFKLLYKRFSDLYKLNFGSFPNPKIPANPSGEILEKCFVWVDMPKEFSTLGGIIGTIKFNVELDEFWQNLLWLGQMVHIGRNSAFGFGKYIIENIQNPLAITKPVTSFLDKLIEKDNLLNAFTHIKENSDFAGTDGLSPEIFELWLDKNINEIIREVKTGNYKASVLQGVIIPKTESKIRSLAIPTVKDRILQRAAVQVMADSIDHLLEENSFAYRKGLSRAGAARAIQNAYNNGFNYVLESDIESFFDNVNWELLLKKINVLYGNDPIYNLLKQWIQSDVLYNGKLIKRSKGLPQGAVISPLLANFYLDEFDEALQDDFKLIRYADDFVILCKSKEQAEAALTEAKEALNKIKLEIKPSKTNIVSFDDGFQYLGYLFLKSMIIEKRKKKKLLTPDKEVVIKEEPAPKGSWLTLVDLGNLNDLKKVKKFKIKPLFDGEDEEILLEKFPLYISNHPYINIDSNTLELNYKEEGINKSNKYQLNNLSSVILIGYNKITLPAVFKLNESKIPVYFCRSNGELKLSIPFHSSNYELWMEQAVLSKDESFILTFAKTVVEAKINNQKIIIRRAKADEYLSSLERFIKKIKNAQTLESLRGLEGSAAVLFFNFLNKSLPEQWKFNSRTKHPPQDPVNTMLSFGYTILYHHISTALQVEGLNPQIGFYHKYSNRYFPLASDLQEEFRHIIDSLILYIIHRNMVTPAAFELNKNNTYPCLMTKDFKKKFIQLVEERLKTEFKPANLTQRFTYKQFFSFQAKLIKSSVRKREMLYKPLRIK